MIETPPTSLPAGSPLFPAVSQAQPQPSHQALDSALADLQANKQAWVELSLDRRIQLLDEILPRLGQVGDDWVRFSLRAKGVPPGGFAEMEEWALFAGVVWLAARRRQVLADLLRYGRPRLPGRLQTLPSGQLSVPIFPSTWSDRLLFMGVTGEVRLAPGVGPADAIELPAYARPGSRVAGQVALVLAAGNASMLPISDLLSRLFQDGQVVLLKMNPVNDYLGPLYESAFQPLIRRGFLRIAYGGPEVGAYLCSHPAVETLHLTGSDKTYEAIVFGPGPEGARRKAERRPLVSKPFTAELGGVNPLIIVPGPWTRQQIRAKAIQLAGFLYSNASSSCLTPRLVIQQQGWAGRAAFVDELGRALEAAGTRPAYYPGAEARHAAYLAAYPGALRFGEPHPGCPPWVILPDVPPGQADAPAFRSESFCGVIGETGLPAAGAAEFIRQAAAFANQKLWGNLTATLLVHPAVLKDSAAAAALREALDTLQYGSVQINTYPAVTYSMHLSPWGAWPGNPPHDIQSGCGFVNNLYHLRSPQKVIFKAPFQALDPVKLSSRRIALFGRAFARFRQAPSVANLVALMRVSDFS